MNPVFLLWSALSGACLMVAVLHVWVWLRDRGTWANLLFAATVAGVVGLAVGELATMRARGVDDYGAILRWAHLLYGLSVAACLGFVRFHFGSGSDRLLALALGLRALAVIANFSSGVCLHIDEIRGLEQIRFLGETVTVLGEWTPNRWVVLGQLASLAQIAYVADASRRLWRRGDAVKKRRALRIGGTLVIFFIAVTVQAGLVAAGLLRMPFVVSVSFLGVVMVMGHELSRGVLNATGLLRELQRSEQQLTLAAAAGKMSLWEWDLRSNRIWVNAAGREMHGAREDEELDFPRFVATIHGPDRTRVERALEAALSGPDPYAAEYRVDLPGRGQRWMAARGRVERDAEGQARRMRGISMDITARKEAELEAARHHQELAHLSRVSVLGELAGTLAHELNQPLAAILGNAQVGRRMMDDGAPDLREIAAIFDDVTDDAKRAGGIIHGMRAMFRKEPVGEVAPVDLNEAVHQVLGLLHGEIVGRRAKLELALAVDLPRAAVGRVELQQVILNLVINGLDAMRGGEREARLEIATERDGAGLRLSVRDHGPGVPVAARPRLFEPFVTSKPGGLGLGLAISRGIAERFGGSLEAEHPADGGALFLLRLPAAAPPPKSEA